jgi:tRNA-dihydrouridine synthase 3
LREKGPDIAQRCHVFETFGSCPAGIKCRFSAAHMSEDGIGSVVDEQRYAAHRETRQAPFPLGGITFADVGKGRVKLPRAENVIATFRSEQRSRESPKDSGGEPATKVSRVASAWAALEAEKRPPLNLAGKLILAPLTTIGNLPFRRVCVDLGADVTVGEMAVVRQILQGEKSEWALMKRHPSEKIFGVQLAGNNVDELSRCAEVLESAVHPDFIDLNCGCPIDLICNKGMGSALLDKLAKLRDCCVAMSNALHHTPFTIKVRTGRKTGKPTTHKILSDLQNWGCAAITLHGRSREQVC